MKKGDDSMSNTTKVTFIFHEKGLRDSMYVSQKDASTFESLCAFIENKVYREVKPEFHDLFVRS